MSPFCSSGAGLAVLLLFAVCAASGPAQEAPPPRTPAVSPSEIHRRIEALGSRYYDEREAAKRELVELGRAAEPDVLAALTSPDFRVRAAAAQILGAWQSGGSIAPLLGRLADEDPEVREAAEKALARFGPEAEPALEASYAAHPELAAEIEPLRRRRLKTRIERELASHITPDGNSCSYDRQFASLAPLGRPCTLLLLELFQNPDYDFEVVEEAQRCASVRTLAGEALIDMADPVIAPDLLRQLEELAARGPRAPGDSDHDEDTAVRILYRLGVPQPFETLRARLELEAAQEQPPGYQHARLGQLLMTSREYVKGEQLYRKVLTRHRSAALAYSLACNLTAQGLKAEALEWLRQAVDWSYKDADQFRLDGDLEPLRSEPEFQALLARMDRARHAGRGAGGDGR